MFSTVRAVVTIAAAVIGLVSCSPGVQVRKVMQTPEGAEIEVTKYHIESWRALDWNKSTGVYIPVSVVASPAITLISEDASADEKRASSLRTAEALAIDKEVERIAGMVVEAVQITNHVTLNKDEVKLRMVGQTFAPRTVAYYFTEGTDLCKLFARLDMSAVKLVEKLYGPAVHNQVTRMIQTSFPEWQNEEIDQISNGTRPAGSTTTVR